MSRQKSKSGFALLPMVVGLGLLGMASTAFFVSLRQFTGAEANGGADLTAELYAAELLEFFRGFDGAGLKRYLERNPIDGLSVGGMGAYPICAHVGILDRVQGEVLNMDPIALLPPVALQTRGFENPNRFYQVTVLDLNTGTFRRDICTKSARDIVLFPAVPGPGQLQLTQTERFFVSVGVNRNAKKRVILSTVIP